MRRPLAVAAFAALALTAPASAQTDAVQALEAIDNRAAIEAGAEVIERSLAMLMAMPVGPMLEPLRRIDPDALPYADEDSTLGDLTDADGNLPERAGEEARVAGTVAGAAARDLAVALPVLTAMARDMAAQWRARIADAREAGRR
jgi:hypothetical protein